VFGHAFIKELENGSFAKDITHLPVACISPDLTKKVIN